MVASQPPSDEVGSWRLPWNELVDGGLRRFKRGVHYSGPAEALEQEARNAAAELGKTAITFRDNMQVFEYMWVQFVDGRLEKGEPCPKCANTSFEKLQEYFLRCTRCRSFFAITEPKPVIPRAREAAHRRVPGPEAAVPGGRRDPGGQPPRGDRARGHVLVLPP